MSSYFPLSRSLPLLVNITSSTPSKVSRNEITASPSLLYPGLTTAPGNLSYKMDHDTIPFSFLFAGLEKKSRERVQ
jgi:hypothetical protein